MKFVELNIENFFRIAKPVRWQLDNQGLVLIYGENGAGKSTLFEALLWCLWGKTIRGYAGDSVVNRRTKKNCCVRLLINHEDQIYSITRYRKHKDGGNGLHFHSVNPGGIPVDLTQGTVSLTQEKINKFLKIDYDTFVQGPMLPQGSFKKFSEMSDAEQKLVLDQALRISVLAAASDIIRERLAEACQKLSAAQGALEGQQLRLSDLSREIASYTAEKAVWAKNKQQSLIDLEKEVLDEILVQERLWQYLPENCSDNDLKAAEKYLQTLKNEKTELEKSKSDTTRQITRQLIDKKSDLKQTEHEMTQAKLAIDKLKKLQGTCPTCKQEINKDHIDSCSKQISEQCADSSVRSQQFTKQINELEKNFKDCMKTFDEQFKELDGKFSEAESNIIRFVRLLEQKKNWINEFDVSQRRETSIRSKFYKKKEETSPFEKLMQEAASSIKDHRKSLVKIKSIVKGLLIEVSHLEFWKIGFSNKGLKSYILKSVTPFLNERANYYANVLTGGDVQIEFSTQTVLKSGETREKFSVVVSNRHGAETYSGNSGGEKSRADLAINYTLSDLVSARANHSFSQRFLDEPFENLDESGIESVMELLADMATSSGSIFVITHQDSMKGLFKRQIRMEKINGETRMAKCP